MEEASKIDLKNLSAGMIIRIVMTLILVSALITLFVNTDKIGKDSKSKKYYGSNIAASVLIMIYLGYMVLYENQFLPE
jgi:hypothetical protein